MPSMERRVTAVTPRATPRARRATVVAVSITTSGHSARERRAMPDNTYKASGVDISAANEMKASFFPVLERSGVTLSRRNSFASIFDANLRAYIDPVLVFKSEEPGSKQVLALDRDRIESVCTDMINHLVNDLIMCGATPVAIQDVIVCGRLDPRIVKRAVGALATAAAAAAGSMPRGGSLSGRRRRDARRLSTLELS